MGRTDDHLAAAARRTAAAFVGAALTTLAAASDACAQSEGPNAGLRMADDMHTYLHGEKWEAPFFIGSGLGSAGVGAFLVTRDDELARGAAYPLFGLGLAQMIVGSVVFFRTDAQVARLDLQLHANPVAFKADEAKRMRGVNRQFVVLMMTELAVIAGGVGMAAVAAQNDCCRTVQGVGLGLVSEGALLLSLDLFAFARGRTYESSLQRFNPGAPRPTAPAGMGSGSLSAWF